MAQTIKRTEYKTKIIVNGKPVERTVYIVDGKRCIIKIK
jgi:hypothetical protein